jgi:LPS export ABC transporter protein LptC
MEISGNVVVRNGSNEMQTEKLFYDHKSRSVSTDTPITMQGDGIRLSGNYMKFSFASEQFMVWGNVDAVFRNFTM